MIGVDTNVLVRYLAKDDETQATRARVFFEAQARLGIKLHIGLVVLAETAWVLRSRYRATRDELRSVVDELLNDHRFEVQDEQAVAVAVDELAPSAADFNDLLIDAVNLLHRCSHTVTLDQGAARLEGMVLLA